jgi:hypothetical protein
VEQERQAINATTRLHRLPFALEGFEDHRPLDGDLIEPVPGTYDGNTSQWKEAGLEGRET